METKEKLFKVIEENLGKGWFKLNEDDMKDIFKVVKIYSSEVKPVVIELKGIDNIRIITEDEFNERIAKWDGE